MNKANETHTPTPWWLEDGNSIMAEFEGQKVQIAVMSHTRWPYPDNGKTQRLHEQSKFNAELMISAPDLLVEVERLQAEAAALREALEAVMWEGELYCSWCAVNKGEEHLSFCQGYNALAADAGRER
jgi:hypothetical protein